MNVVVALFLLAPLVLVPLGFRLLEVASPGSRPSALALRLVPAAGALLVVAFVLSPGPVAAVFAFPWLVVTGATAAHAAIRWMRDPARLRPDTRHATDAAVGFLAVGAAFALTDRLGIRPFGFPSTIILLTAVHFHFAGFVLPLAAALAYTRRPSRWIELAIGAVVVGIPITALGFLGLPLANWIGAILTAAGGFGIGIATLTVARALHGRTAALLGALAGASLLIAMPLAATYATGTLTGVSSLGLDTMARVHGGLNALGFALPAMVAWTLDHRSRRPIGVPVVGAIGSPVRRWSFGFVIGAVFGFGVLVGGTLVGALGLIALSLLAWERGRAAPIGGALIGVGAMWVVLFGRVELTCQTDCAASDVSIWIAAGAGMVALGAALSLHVLRWEPDLDALSGTRIADGNGLGAGPTWLAASPSAPARDPRRLGLGAAAITAGYACVVGLISASAGDADLGAPDVVPRPVVLAALLMLPAAISAIGAWRRSGPVLIAAGIVCLAQSFIAFSGVTIPFVVPAILLLAIGSSIHGAPASRRAIVGSVAIVALGFGAWFALLGTTETACWVARRDVDGALVYTQIPETNTFTMGLEDVASGCDGGALSIKGITLAAILALGAIAVAELSSRPPDSAPAAGPTTSAVTG